MRNINHDHELKVLFASADVALATVIEDYLAVDGISTDRCTDAKGILRIAGRSEYPIIVLDLELTQEADVNLVSFILRQSPGVKVILLYGPEDVDRAIEGIRQGAFFYLPKSCTPRDISLVVHKAVKSRKTEAVADQLEKNVFEELTGGAPAMRRIAELIAKVAPTDSAVLFLGESGTGKEVLANTLHRLSPRSDKPFVAINCAALPEALLESEMFGHVKGSFTGAVSDKEGLFEKADGGTIFLDEVGDMPLPIQAKLLRALQNGEIRRVGATTSRYVDVRVVAATNADLIAAVREKTFREDLYFRLNVFQIVIPPLRERMESLDNLVGYFIKHYSQRYGKKVVNVDERAELLIRSYPYPGNVRELESVIAHAVILCDDGVIREKDLPDQVRYGAAVRPALPRPESAGIRPMSEVEEEHIRRALEQLDGNQTDAAKKLGISRSTLWRKMKEYNIPSSTTG